LKHTVIKSIDSYQEESASFAFEVVGRWRNPEGWVMAGQNKDEASYPIHELAPQP
jgi:hypothetical protein